jgi:hypothetical protein
MSLSPFAVAAFSVVLTAIVAALGWVARALLEIRDSQRDLKVLLVGVDGQNGINSEVKGLRKRAHENENRHHSLAGRIGLVEQRVTTLEGKP